MTDEPIEQGPGDGSMRPTPTPDASSERSLDELSDQELEESGFRRVDFNGHSLVIRKMSILLGLWGLPVTVREYARGDTDARAVGQSLLRSRIAHAPEGFKYRSVEFDELVRLVALCSTDPQLPQGSVAEIADSLVQAQERQEQRIQSAHQKVAEFASGGARVMQRLQFSIRDALNANPFIKSVLASQTPAYRQLPSGDYYLTRYASDKTTAQKAIADIGRSQRIAERNVARAAMAGPQLSVQDYFMGPSEMTKSVRRVVAALHDGSLVVPPSLAKLGDTPTISGDDLRAATSDAAALAREQGQEGAAEFLDLTQKTLDRGPDAVPATDAESAGLVEQAQSLFTSYPMAPPKDDRTFQVILMLVGVLLSLWLQQVPGLAPQPPIQILPVPEQPESPPSEPEQPDVQPAPDPTAPRVTPADAEDESDSGFT